LGRSGAGVFLEFIKIFFLVLDGGWPGGRKENLANDLAEFRKTGE
jgi:hypothetical protein